MADLGLRTEALLLHAESYALEQLSLHELRYRLRFAESIADAPVHCEPLYRLALLLERVREPARARAVHERIVSIDPGFRDSVERSAKFGAAASMAVVPNAIVETFVGRVELLLEEIEKWAVLGERWQWASAVHREMLKLGAGNLEPLSALKDAFGEKVEWELAAGTFVDVATQRLREAQLAVRRDAAIPWLSATVEIAREADGWHAVTRWAVDGAAEGSPDAAALELGRRIAEWRGPAATQLQERVTREVQEALKQLLGLRSATSSKKIKF